MHINFNIRNTPTINKKINMRACISNNPKILLNLHMLVFLLILNRIVLLIMSTAVLRLPGFFLEFLSKHFLRNMALHSKYFSVHVVAFPTQ